MDKARRRKSNGNKEKERRIENLAFKENPILMNKVYNPLTSSNLSLMEFIEAKIDPNSTLKMLSKMPRRGPQS